MYRLIQFHRLRDSLRRLSLGRDAPRRPRRAPLRIEPLEQRVLLSLGDTYLVADINPGAADSNPESLVTVGEETFFLAGDGVNGSALWKSDGTDTTLLTTTTVEEFTNSNDSLFFTYPSPVLRKIDPSTDARVIVKDFGPGNVVPFGLTDVDGTLFFAASDWDRKSGGHGIELWKSDGTEKGTNLVKDIYTGTTRECQRDPDTRRRVCAVTVNSSAPADLIDVNGALFFSADDGTGRALWRTADKGGAQLVKDIAPSHLTNINGVLFFHHGGHRWISDGTPRGTVPLKDFVLGLTGELNLGGTRIFPADDGLHGWELWQSDGTHENTMLIKDINPGGDSSDPGGFSQGNGTLLFSADDDTNGRELWTTDGTTDGTVLVQDINPGSASSSPRLLTGANTLVYFSANDAINGEELWQSDGTAAGTMLVADINPGSASSKPAWLTVAGRHLFFTADDGMHGRELWDPPIAAAREGNSSADASESGSSVVVLPGGVTTSNRASAFVDSALVDATPVHDHRPTAPLQQDRHSTTPPQQSNATSPGPSSTDLVDQALADLDPNLLRDALLTNLALPLR